MKTKEELNELKEEVEALNKKLAELTEEELKQVSGGFGPSSGKKKKLYCVKCGYVKGTFPAGVALCWDVSEECPQCGASPFAMGDA